MDGNTSGGFNSIGGTTESELRWSQWWVDHRDRIRKVGIDKRDPTTGMGDGDFNFSRGFDIGDWRFADDAQEEFAGNVTLPFNTEGMYRGFARVGEAVNVSIYG